jgi:outer membrane protein assembly factor BamB
MKCLPMVKRSFLFACLAQAGVKKRITGVLAVVVAAVLMSATPAMAADWPNARSDAANTGSSAETLGLPLTERWHSSPHVEENGAVVSNGVVYMSSDTGKLYAFEVATGEGVKGFPVATAFNFGAPAVDAANKKVYVLASGKLYAFNLDGTSAWTKEVGATGNNYNVGPVVEGGFVYLKAGETLKKYDSTGELKWSSPSAGDNTQPAVMGSFVYVNSNAGQIRKYATATGTEVTAGGFPISTASDQDGLAVANGTIFHKADKLYAYNASTGATAWSAADGGDSTFTDSPAVSNGVVYVYGWDAKLYAFNETTGAPMTGFPSAALSSFEDRNYSSPTVAGDKVYVGAGTSQKLKVLGAAGSAKAGEVLAEYPTFSADFQGFDLPSPIVSGGFVFAMLDGGGLYAFSPGKASGGKITINGGASCTESRTVTLTIEAGSNTEMRISEDPLFIGVAFEPVASSKQFTLSAGFGKKTVYIQFKNGAGELSNVFNAQIQYAASCSGITLGPETAENPVGTNHTLTATVTESGKPQSGVTVTFTVTGANPQTGTGVTNEKGEATFTYKGEKAGTDTIVASFKDKAGKTDESNSAKKIWTEVAIHTCGKTTVGKTKNGYIANIKRVNACVLPVNATVSELSVYLTTTSHTGQQLIKGVLYADSKGNPAGLLGTTTQLTFTSKSATGWYHLKFPTPLKLAAGHYWIGVITGATQYIAAEYFDSVANAEDYNTNTYTSGPSNPFGSFKTTNEQMSLYATYTSAST